MWEALNFSAMDQLKTLWPDEYKGGLPVIFNFMDNGYGMGGRTNGETWPMASWPGWAPASPRTR